MTEMLSKESNPPKVENPNQTSNMVSGKMQPVDQTKTGTMGLDGTGSTSLVGQKDGS